MNVVYFSKSSELGPSSRYRAYQFLPYLHAAGIDCSVRPLLGPAYFKILEIQFGPIRFVAKTLYAIARFVKRGCDLLAIHVVDLVVVEGQLFPYCPATIERLLVRLKRKIVIELDDAIYLTRFHQRKIPALLRIASGAIVGNQTLAQYAQAFTDDVIVVPTVVDTDRFRPAESSTAHPHQSEVMTIVWVGLAYNLPYLELLAPTIRELQRTDRVRFRVISSRPPRLPEVEVDFTPWTFGSEVEELQRCHIGVMPLPNDEWARGKCGLKLLQYMAVGLAAVASPVGVNREIVQDGANGFWAQTEDEWHSRLLSLCRDSTLRVRMGQVARRTVEERYSLRVWGPRLAEEYRNLANREKNPGAECGAVFSGLKG